MTGDTKTPATKAATTSPAKPTVCELCRQWEIVAAKLNVEVLERGHEQDTIDHLCEPAEARWREIEGTILATDPDTIRDVDLVVLLRLARKIIGDDQYATSADAAEAMLDLIETTLVHRTEPADWERGGAVMTTLSLTYRTARLRLAVLRLKATRSLGWRALRKWALMRVLTVTCWAAERLVEPEARRRLDKQSG